VNALGEHLVIRAESAPWDRQRERLHVRQAPYHRMIGRLPRNLLRSLQGLSEPSARSDSGQSRGGFSEQTHGRAGYFEVVGGCGDRCRGRPDNSDHGGHAVGPD
jgi:hypothetical protein